MIMHLHRFKKTSLTSIVGVRLLRHVVCSLHLSSITIRQEVLSYRQPDFKKQILVVFVWLTASLQFPDLFNSKFYVYIESTTFRTMT